jgi:hypothetical protein
MTTLTFWLVLLLLLVGKLWWRGTGEGKAPGAPRGMTTEEDEIRAEAVAEVAAQLQLERERAEQARRDFEEHLVQQKMGLIRQAREKERAFGLALNKCADEMDDAQNPQQALDMFNEFMWHAQRTYNDRPGVKDFDARVAAIVPHRFRRFFINLSLYGNMLREQWRA